jgi:tetraacyldisaccharide 4'-kinase
MRLHVPGLWLGISPDRYEVGLQISKRTEHSVFILDDGFQHRRLRRNLDLLVIDRTQPLASNRMLPLGSLREPLAGLRRADIVVLNGHPEAGLDEPGEEIMGRIKPNGNIFHCIQRIERLVSFAEWREKGPAAPGRDVGSAFLVAAIGNPQRFLQDVRTLGIDIRGSRFFRDHHRLSLSDWHACAGEARRLGAESMIATEKDAVKVICPLDVPLLVAIQSTQLDEQAVLERMLAAMTKENP